MPGSCCETYRDGYDTVRHFKLYALGRSLYHPTIRFLTYLIPAIKLPLCTVDLILFLLHFLSSILSVFRFDGFFTRARDNPNPHYFSKRLRLGLGNRTPSEYRIEGPSGNEILG